MFCRHESGTPDKTVSDLSHVSQQALGVQTWQNIKKPGPGSCAPCSKPHCMPAEVCLGTEAQETCKTCSVDLFSEKLPRWLKSKLVLLTSVLFVPFLLAGAAGVLHPQSFLHNVLVCSGVAHTGVKCSFAFLSLLEVSPFFYMLTVCQPCLPAQHTCRLCEQ